MKPWKWVIIVLCMLVLSGCWSRRELNDILIVLGVAMDWANDEYLISYQVVNPGEISAQKEGGQRPPGTVYQGRGKTLLEAARYVTAEAPRKMYFGHLQILVVSEALAKRGLSELFDGVLRDNETRLDFNIVVARGSKAESFMKLYTPVEKLPTYSMLQSLRTSEKSWAPTVSVTMDQAMDRLSGNGYELALTGIQLFGDPQLGESSRNVESFRAARRFRYKGIAVFRGDRLAGWLNENESKGYSDITDNLDSTSVELPCGGGRYMAIEILSSKAKLATELIDGRPAAEVRIRSEAAIVDRPCTELDLTDVAVIEEIEQQAARAMQANAEAAVAKVKGLKSDVLGFGNQISKDYPAYWEQVKDSWNAEQFPQLDVRYRIELFIRKTGTIGNSTLKD
ncbi:Ger(x)C family spore germination protein [Paenibacillus sp. PL2-23]|uniref:Ger(x)C family spore germination protein n=1 Tax=Paenibacillus sp. PL2-23 TaxID=2100729 RepID=UPI0030FA2450